ncbi:MAG: AMP-binding protein [Pseudomonadota bacterium]
MASDTANAATFPELLLRNAQVHSGKPAIQQKRRGIWRTTTWSEMAAEAACLTAALKAKGLAPGAVVALVGDNRPRLFIAMAAAQAAGAIAAPLFQDSNVAEMAPWFKRLKPTHVFAENQEQTDKVLEILPDCPSITCIAYDDDRGMRHYKNPEVVSYESLLEEGKGAPLDGLASDADGSRDAFVFHTSGTTGDPKPVVHTHQALIERARAAARIEGFSADDTTLAYLSPGWMAQTLFAYVHPMVAGSSTCCPESSDTLLDDLREIAPTHLVITPRMLDTIVLQISARMQDTGGFNQRLYRNGLQNGQKGGLLYSLLLYKPLRDSLGMSRIRDAYTVGDLLPEHTMTFFRTLGINLKQLYGTTETGFFDVLQRDEAVSTGTLGTAVEGVELKISDSGEVLMRSSGLFREYFGDADATAAALQGDGWFRTGDLGALSESGELRLTDRVSDIGALADGTPFRPKTIEARLTDNSEIRAAVVIGDGRDGVCALVDVDTETVGRWADGQEISFTGHSDLASRDEVYDLVGGLIEKANAQLASDPATAPVQIRRFLLLPDALSAGDGLLTPTGRLRRSAIADHYAGLIEALYSDRTDVPIENVPGHAHEIHDDVHGGPAALKLRDAKVTGDLSSRRAA